jgi:neutral ceramidase
VGRCQAEAAEALLGAAEPAWAPLRGPLRASKRFFDFSRYELEPDAGSERRRTCPAVSGVNMLAGTEDGRGLALLFREGGLRRDGGQDLLHTVARAIGHRIVVPIPDGVVPSDVEECQRPKVPMFATGLATPVLATPQVLPLQVLKLGQLALLALPFEVTTMAGRRLAQTAREADANMQHAVLAAVSNAYSGYLTTREEYQLQHYEGSCTHFGQHQLEATQRMLRDLLLSERGRTDGQGTLLQGEVLLDRLDQVQPDPPVIWQMPGAVATQLAPRQAALLAPPWAKLGDLYDQNTLQLVRGQVLQARFWCARPLNSQIFVESFCDLQQLDLHQQEQQHEHEREHEHAQATWKTVARDNDWNVRFMYRAKWALFGLCTCQWVVPRDEREGAVPEGAQTYRLVMRGALARDDDGKQPLLLYTGASNPAKLARDAPPDPRVLVLAHQYRNGALPEEVHAAALAVLALALALRACRSRRRHLSAATKTE